MFSWCIEAFYIDFRYLADLFNIYNVYLEQIDKIHPNEIELNKANTSNTERSIV